MGLILALGACVAPREHAAARALASPLLVGSFYRWHGVTAQTRLAATGREVWVAAAEGLRRYDLEHRTLGRPATVPPGRTTAVVATDGVVWTAVEGRLYQRAGEGWRPEAQQPDLGEVSALALDGTELWVASTRGLFHRPASGSWRRIEVGFAGASGDGAGLVSAAGGVAWAFAYAARPTGYETAFVRVAGDRVERFTYPQGPAMTIPSVLAAQGDGSVVVATSGNQGAALEGGQLQRFDGIRWTPCLGCTGYSGCLGAVDGEQVWVLEGGGLRAYPPSSGMAPGRLPDELGPFVGAVATADGLFVLGELRLGRWREGRWTVFGAPMPDGTSTERAIPNREGFYPSVGPALTPAPLEAQLAEVAKSPLSPDARIDGVPVYLQRPPNASGTADADNPGYLAQHLPDFDPGQIFRLTGVYVGPGGRRGAPALIAVAGPIDVMPLAAPLPLVDTEDGPFLAGTLVTIDARLGFCPAPDGNERACFEPVGAPLQTRPLASALEAARQFERQHLEALRNALIPEGHREASRRAYVAGNELVPYYDGTRNRVLLLTWNRLEGGYELDVGYVVDARDAVEAVVGLFWFVGE